MTVGELIEQLSELDRDRIVVLSSDAEGNSYSPVAGFWTGAYQPENGWSGEVGLEKLTDEDRKGGYTEEDVLEGQPAVILKPMN